MKLIDSTRVLDCICCLDIESKNSQNYPKQYIFRVVIFFQDYLSV